MRSRQARINVKAFISVPLIIQSRLQLTDTLVEWCSQFASVKDFQAVKKLSDLIDDPVGRLYEAIAAGDYNQPHVFAHEKIPDRYKSRMDLCVAQSYRVRGDLHAAWDYLLEGSKLSRLWQDSVTEYQTLKEIAIIRSLDGDHLGALKSFGYALRFAQANYPKRPAHYFDCLNGLAVELGEVGRLREAMQMSRLVLASPYAPYYPEWYETGTELDAKRGQSASNSVIFIGRPVEIETVIAASADSGNVISHDFSAKPQVSDNSLSESPAGKLLGWKMTNDQATKKPITDSLTEEERANHVAEIVRRIYNAPDGKLREVLETLTRQDTEGAREQ
jgi:hypothetical protein